MAAKKPPRITTGGPATADRIHDEATARGFVSRPGDSRANHLRRATQFLQNLNNPGRKQRPRASAGGAGGH